MTIRVPRSRTIGVRLSEEEYSALENYCVEIGARSISDLARAAICNLVRRGDEENALASALNQNVAQVREMQQRIEMLTAEIALLKKDSETREDAGNAGEPAPGADSSPPESRSE